MKVAIELPPIWDKILEHGLNPDTSKVIFTYGDTIYNPGAQDIPEYLLYHEEVHTKQQGDNPDAWWERYLTDITFRIEQEAEAYGRQFKFICSQVKDKNHRIHILVTLARTLSGPTYGNVISHIDAMNLIRKHSGIK